MRKGLLLFFIQVLLNVVIVFNLRAIAQANYTWTILSEVVIGMLALLTLKSLIDDSNKREKAVGYIFGNVVGSIIGIFLSQIILKN